MKARKEERRLWLSYLQSLPVCFLSALPEFPRLTFSSETVWRGRGMGATELCARTLGCCLLAQIVVVLLVEHLCLKDPAGHD
jgi:hypothetical protein